MSSRLMRVRAALVPAFVVLSIATLALAETIGTQRDLPDPSKTPGVVLTTDRATICSMYANPGEGCEPGHQCGVAGSYSQRHRRTTREMKEEVLARYGILSDAEHFTGEIDHLVPLCAGGQDDVFNLWPQPASGTWNYHDKDRLETWACRQICSARTMTPVQAQALFMPDWRVSLCRTWPTDSRCPR